MTRSLPLPLALWLLFQTSSAAADEHASRTAILGVETVYERAPTLELLATSGCGFFCSTEEYLGLNQAGTALRVEYRERRSRIAGVRLTGRLGWTHGWWLVTRFEGGLLGAGERDGQTAIARSSMVPVGVALGPIFFVKRTTISPALSWDGAFRVGDLSRLEDEATSHDIPRAVHLLGVEVAADHRVGSRARLFGTLRIGGVTGTGNPFDVGYRLSLGVTVDLRPTG